MKELPAGFSNETELEAFMSRPSDALIDDLSKVDGGIMVLGVGGKMGPTLAMLAKRAAPQKRVIGVARFSDRSLRERLQAAGVETITCDLLQRDELGRLEDCANIIYMAGRKFGASEDQPLTWAMNAHVPALVAERFRRSRIIAFSTACVYALSDVAGGGSLEGDALAPPGEYANSCIARERMFEYFSARHKTPGRLIRLSYAIDMRYGVLHDIAQAVLHDAPVPVAMPYVNVIWQGDANSCALRALAATTTPTTALNVSGPEMTDVRELAQAFGQRFGRTPQFTGQPQPTAWLVNTAEQQRLFGPPSVALETLIGWTADWVENKRPSLGKPTHFDTRDGSY